MMLGEDGSQVLGMGEVPPNPEETQEVAAPVPPSDLDRLRPLFMSVEEYLKSYWHDPRFGVRYAVGFLQLLQNEDLTVSDLEDLTLQQIGPVEAL